MRNARYIKHSLLPLLLPDASYARAVIAIACRCYLPPPPPPLLWWWLVVVVMVVVVSVVVVVVVGVMVVCRAFCCVCKKKYVSIDCR